MEQKIKQIAEKLTEAIENLNKKDFTIHFFIIDTKGNPNGSTQYIYETASQLIDEGYKCKMLHQEKDFVGVGDWMGEKYANIVHQCVESDNVKISTSDFLIIPEIFANVMNQTKNLPCKRIVLCQNVNFISEFIPLGSSWGDYGLLDVITTTETQANDIKELFPYAKTKVVNPSIPNYFRDNDEPKKLTISIVTKEQATVNKIVKQFHWKYPQYSWVTFNDLRGYNREKFSDLLRESAITVLIDDETYFGYTAIEAMKSGSLVIGKIPEVIPEWMYDDDKTSLVDNGIWFTDFRKIHNIIAQAIKLWMEDAIPETLYEEASKTALKYTVEDKVKQLNTVFGEYVTERIAELQIIQEVNNNKLKEIKE